MDVERRHTHLLVSPKGSSEPLEQEPSVRPTGAPEALIAGLSDTHTVDELSSPSR